MVGGRLASGSVVGGFNKTHFHHFKLRLFVIVLELKVPSCHHPGTLNDESGSHHERNSQALCNALSV